MHSLATTHNPTPRPAPRGHLRPPPAPTLYLRRRLYPPLAFLHPPTPHARWPPPPLAPPTLSCPGHDQVQHVGHWSCCGHDQGYESRLIFCCDNNSYNPGDGCDHELGSNGGVLTHACECNYCSPHEDLVFRLGPTQDQYLRRSRPRLHASLSQRRLCLDCIICTWVSLGPAYSSCG